jgi:dihydroorotate dehydrogenase electron transfer subunit
MKKQVFLEIISNEFIAKNTLKLCLISEPGLKFSPGQFLNIKVDSFYLRRPMSVCDFDDKTITVIYKIVGKGTNALSQIRPRSVLDIILPLGNGFDIEKSKGKIALIGGGAGLAAGGRAAGRAGGGESLSVSE